MRRLYKQQPISHKRRVRYLGVCIACMVLTMNLSLQHVFAAESSSFRLYSDSPNYSTNGPSESSNFSINEDGATWAPKPGISSSFQVVPAPQKEEVVVPSGGSTGGSGGGGSGDGGGRRGNETNVGACRHGVGNCVATLEEGEEVAEVSEPEPVPEPAPVVEAPPPVASVIDPTPAPVVKRQWRPATPVKRVERLVLSDERPGVVLGAASASEPLTFGRWLSILRSLEPLHGAASVLRTCVYRFPWLLLLLLLIAAVSIGTAFYLLLKEMHDDSKPKKNTAKEKREKEAAKKKEEEERKKEEEEMKKARERAREKRWEEEWEKEWQRKKAQEKKKEMQRRKEELQEMKRREKEKLQERKRQEKEEAKRKKQLEREAQKKKKKGKGGRGISIQFAINF